MLPIVANWLVETPWAYTLVVCPKKSPSISPTLKNVELASNITAFATMLDVFADPLANFWTSLSFSGLPNAPGLSPIDEDNVIEVVDSLKYLGMILDSQLKYYIHAEYVRSKFVQRLKVLSCIRYQISEKTSVDLYKSLNLPRLEYADIIYDSLSIKSAANLQKIQNNHAAISLKSTLCPTRWNQKSNSRQSVRLANANWLWSALATLWSNSRTFWTKWSRSTR